MKPVEIRRIYAEVEQRLDGDAPTQVELSDSVFREAMATVDFTVGWCLGGDNPYGAMLVIVLAERVFGSPALLSLKYKVGLASHPEGARPPVTEEPLRRA
jgi:hypothetical protein